MHCSTIACYDIVDICRYIIYWSICMQIKINDETYAALIDILTILLKDELLEGYTVEGTPDV